MNKINFLTWLIGALFMASCTTSKPLTSEIQPTEVNDIQLFEPLAFISLIEKGNKAKLNDSISNVSKDLMQQQLEKFNRIPLSGKVELKDSIVQMKLAKEMEYLCIRADRERSISALELTPVIDSLLEANEKRFGLITITSGFTRAKGNYGEQVAKGAAMGVLTLGMYYQTPIKFNSTVYAMIVDAQDDNIAFFRKSFVNDEDPLEALVLATQIQKIFEGYFWEK